MPTDTAFHSNSFSSYFGVHMSRFIIKQTVLSLKQYTPTEVTNKLVYLSDDPIIVLYKMKLPTSNFNSVTFH